MRQCSLRRVFHFWRSLLGRTQGDREPVSLLLLLLLAIPVGDAIWDCSVHFSFFFFFFYFFFFLFFSATILSGPYLWNRCSQRLQIECAAWSYSLILHCCLPSNSLRYFFSDSFFFATIIFFPPQFFFPLQFFFFPPQFCPGHSLR